MTLIDLLGQGHDLARDIQNRGPQITTSMDAAKEFLARYPEHFLTEKQVGGVILFMVLTPDWQQYSPSVFVSAIEDIVVKDFSWQNVVQEFDRPSLTLSPDQFLAIFNALLPIAQRDSQFDIQSLWGGQWQHNMTQLSFVIAYASLSSSQLDAETIPGLRQSYDPSAFIDGPGEMVQYVEEARRDPMISRDAVIAIFDFISNAENHSTDAIADLKEVIKAKMGFFLCSAVSIPQASWNPIQQNIMLAFLNLFLLKESPDYKYVLHLVWSQDKQWVAKAMVESHAAEPMRLPALLDLALELGWLEELCTIPNGFGTDMAALAHRRGLLDLEQWAEEKEVSNPQTLTSNVHKFLVIKAQDEMRTSRNEQHGPRTVPLGIKTVYSLLNILENHPTEDLVFLERQCLQAFPRLINYNEGFDDLIDKLGEGSNSLSAATDAQMQDIYKRMYNGDLECREIIQELEKYKKSDDGAKQDLYACMIHGLFDEFGCFKEYPVGPLATTAVLFGGIINYGLVSDLTLRVGLGMILEAVRDWSPETAMYKFGLQALLQLQDRLPEWPGYCAQLVQIPGLQGTEPYNKAIEVYGGSGSQVGLNSETNGVNGLADGLGLSNGEIENFLAPEVMPFKSIHADPAMPSDIYEDPDEETQEKVVFFFNNVSEQNVLTKLNQLQEALKDRHHQWFAYFLVEQRAKVEPNYQQLYLDLLKLLGKKSLWNEVLRETYVSIQKMMNAESTMKSASERKNLKNLSTWLGSLTIARDKPIKQRNISFKDLLIEGFDTQRLLIVIPFTCNVLVQAAKSVVFKPPNPWIIEIIRLLLELYHHADIKLNQKFEIEVLCKELNITPNTYEVSTDIRTRPVPEEELGVTMMPDGIDGFEDLTLGSINRNVRNARFSPSMIASSLPDLEALLVFPPSSGSAANQARLRQIVQNAVQRAIFEIIAPVVERSVTIATIATTNLIHKDFARESDEDRIRKAAQQMVRQLSGSLALVTCKEPLRMSMTNYIRMAQAELPDQAFPEGAILMCVNDNLDTACSIVEKQAEDRSMPEIETHIENEIAQRRQYTAEHPNESYLDPGYSRWATCIPDPYKLTSGGLNQEQLAIYLDFARQSRGTTNHAQSSSADSGRQLPDVLQESFATAPNIPTPGDAPAVSHQLPQQQQAGRMVPPLLPVSSSQPLTQEYLDPRAFQERIQELIANIGRLCKDRHERYLKDFTQDTSIADTVNQIWELVVSSHSNIHSLALTCAHTICVSLHTDATSPLMVDVLVQLLQRLCQLSPGTHKEVLVWFANQDDEKVFNVPVTVSLLEAGLMELRQVDMTLTKSIEDRRDVAIDFMFEITDALLLNSHPIALRADFAGSLGAMGHWLAEEPGLTRAKELMQRMKDWGVHEVVDSRPDERSLIRQHQLQYIFAEWVTICNNPNPAGKVFGAFISQLHQKQLLNSQEEMALFLRLCIDSAIEAYEREDMSVNGSANEAYFTTDCLAKLVVLLVKNQGETHGAVRGRKPAYMNSMLSLITLILNSHHVMRGERFNQRVFFRLFSSILCDWHDLAQEGYLQNRDMMLVFADNFLMLEPRHFPGFTYSWLILISHRIFMPGLLKLADDEVRPWWLNSINH
jgi:CCR4-NOT transcription complex subunit 1